MKSRNLSPLDYLEQLQLEYIVAELRKKIYPARGDREFQQKLMEGKKEKVKFLSSKNGSIPTIFTDTKTKERLYLKIYNPVGLPNFIYKDENTKLVQRKRDIEKYYKEGSNVTISNKEITKVGKILNVNLDAELVEVEFQDSTFGVFSIKNATRII